MARAINADALKTSCKITGEFMNNFECVSLATLGEIIDKQPTIEPKQEWIDVHDRIPDKDTLVLCVGVKGGMFLGFVRYLYGDDKTAYVRVPNARGGRYAAFWMPLPEPPKEEE